MSQKHLSCCFLTLIKDFEEVVRFKTLDFLTYAFEGSERYRGSMMREVHQKLVQDKGWGDEIVYMATYF